MTRSKAVTGTFEFKNFDLTNLSARAKPSNYPFDELDVGQGFAVLKKASGISSRVSVENRKSGKTFITRGDPEATSDHPKCWVIRIT